MTGEELRTQLLKNVKPAKPPLLWHVKDTDDAAFSIISEDGWFDTVIHKREDNADWPCGKQPIPQPDMGLPCKIGDDLYYCSEHNGIVEINVQKNGVREITISASKISVSDGTLQEPDVIGSQYALLTHEDAIAYAKEHYAGEYIIDRVQFPHKEIVLVWCNPGEDALRIKTPLTMESFESLVGHNYGVNAEDENGMVGIYDLDAKKQDKPFNKAAVDKDGNIVDILFGSFVVVQSTVDENGFKVFTDMHFDDSCEHWDDDDWCLCKKDSPKSSPTYEVCENFEKGCED